MKKLHVAQIGDILKTADRFRFSSTQNILEYDFILIDVHTLIYKVDGINQMSYDAIENRFNDLKDFVKRKDTPIVFFCSESGTYFPSSSVGASNLYRSLGIEAETALTQGKKIEINPSSIFFNFMEKYKEHFFYTRAFTKHVGTNIGNAQSKNLSVGFYTNDIAFLPELLVDHDRNEHEFLLDLYQVCRSIRKGDEPTNLPAWTNEYVLPGEKSERENLNKIESEIERLLKEKEETHTRLTTFLPLKQLWSGTGATLEHAAKLAFEELGFTIMPAEPNRDDIIMTRGDQTIIVEVKGLTKSAGEKNAGQLQKWLGGYMADHGVEAKGILLVNAFREMPLNERTQDAFPAQMIPFATRTDQCLLTTTELCSLLLHCRKHPEEKDAILDDLLSTVGIYNKYNQWDQYIEFLPNSKSTKTQTAKAPSKKKKGNP